MTRSLPPLRRLAAALALVGPLLAACESSSGPDGALRVRVHNAGTVPLTALAVVFPHGERLEAAVVAPGASTPYTAVQLAYRYAYVEAVVDGRRVVLQPIDYVGEQPMAGPCVAYDLRATAQAIEIAARTEPCAAS